MCFCREQCYATNVKLLCIPKAGLLMNINNAILVLFMYLFNLSRESCPGSFYGLLFVLLYLITCRK